MGQSIFSNALIATIGRGGTLACGLAATALMTRMLGVDGFGTYSLILTIAAMIQLVADFGLYLTLSRELGVSNGKPSEKIANIASLRLTLLLVLFGIGSVVVLTFPSARTYAAMFIVLAIGLMFQSGSQLFMGIFQAYGAVWRATLGDILGRVVQVVTLATGLFIFPASIGPLWVAYAFTGGLILSFLVHIVVLPNKKLLRIKMSRSAWVDVITVSWPIALMLILNVIYFRIDTVLLSSLRTSEEVGLYSLAYKVIENALFFPAMIGGLLLPAITSALSLADHTKAQKLLMQSLTLSFSGAAILVAILMAFPTEIIVLLGGKEFAASGALVRILAIALGSMFLGNIFGFTLIALAKQKALAILYGVLAALNIAANLVLIPSFGAAGAAWVTVATEIGATVTAGCIVYRSIAWRFPVYRSMVILFGACASVAVSALLLAEGSIWLRLGMALVLYIGIMHVCGVWSKQSLSILRASSQL